MPQGTIFKTTCYFCHLPPTGFYSNILTLGCNMDLCCYQCWLRCWRLCLWGWETSWGAQMTHSAPKCANMRKHSALSRYKAAMMSNGLTIPNLCVMLYFVCILLHASLQLMFPWKLWSRFVSGFHHIHKTTNRLSWGKTPKETSKEMRQPSYYTIKNQNSLWTGFQSAVLGHSQLGGLVLDCLQWLTLPILRWSRFLASSWKRSHSFSIFESGKEIP